MILMTLNIEQTFKAIADPTRRAIIGLLAEKERAAGDVARRFAISRPAIAKHLKILREGGIVVTRRDGRERFNRLNPEGLKMIFDWIAHYERFWDEKLLSLKKAAEKGKEG